MGKTIIFFDLETGGVEDDHPDIQIAAIATQDLVEIDSFEVKLRFDVDECDPEALEINSFDPDLWEAEAVPVVQGWRSFAHFCSQYADTEFISKKSGRPYRVTRLAGQNVVAFDIPRAKRAVAGSGVRFWRACWWYPFDTYQRAIWYFQENGLEPPSDYQLTTLADHFGIEIEGEAHDALVDVRTCLQITREIVGGGA